MRRHTCSAQCTSVEVLFSFEFSTRRRVARRRREVGRAARALHVVRDAGIKRTLYHRAHRFVNLHSIYEFALYL